MSAGNDDYQSLMSKGHSAAWDLDWVSASGFYRQALDEIPGDSQALLSLGLALFEMQDYREALDIYQQAAKIETEDPIPVEKVAQISEKIGEDPIAVPAAMRAADLYLARGDVEKAIENWSLVTRLDPHHLMAHSRLALAHERMGRNAQAVTEYLSVASLLQHTGKLSDAVQVGNHALQLMPANDNTRQALTMLEENQPLPLPTRPEVVTGPLAPLPDVPALAQPEPGTQIEDNLDPIEAARKAAMAALANTLFELSEEGEEEQPEERRGLQEITSGSGSTRSKSDRTNLIYRLRQAIDFQTQGQLDEAASELEQIFEMGLEIPAVHYSLGQLYIESGRIEGGLRLLQRSINDDAYALGGRLLIGKTLKERARLRDAALSYLQALKIADALVVAPAQADALRQMYEPIIEAHITDADDEEHEQVCDNIGELLIRPDWRTFLGNARRELPVAGEDAPPAPIAEIITQARSGQIVGALTAIHQYARNGMLRVAMEEAYHALDYAPTYLPLHALMGDLLMKQNRITESITKYSMVAKAYSARGDSGRARELFHKIIKLAPMDLDARQQLIDQLTVSGDIDGALRQYLETAGVYIRLAELGNARKTFSRALQLAQQTNADRDWSVRILHQMADIDMQRLDWRQGLRIYEQIRQLAPGDAKARRSLIDLNLRMGQEPKALNELDTYLGYLVQSGRQQDAVEILKELASIHKTNAAINQRMAELYQSLGLRNEAIQQWDLVGEISLEVGDQQGAVRAVQAIIALEPPNVQDYQQLLSELQAG